jgi:hypothetical protein
MSHAKDKGENPSSILIGQWVTTRGGIGSVPNRTEPSLTEPKSVRFEVFKKSDRFGSVRSENFSVRFGSVRNF